MQASSSDTPNRRRIELNQPLTLIAAALCAGITLDRGMALGGTAATACCFTALAAWLACWRQRWETAGSCCVLLAIAACGARMHDAAWNRFSSDDIGLRVGANSAPIAVEAFAVDYPLALAAEPPSPLQTFQQAEAVRLPLQLAAVRDGRRWRRAVGRASLWVQADALDVRPGDRLRVYCQARRIEPPANPGEFDFAAHARADRTLVTLRTSFAECVERRGERRASWLSKIAEVRRQVAAILSARLSPQVSPLASALLLGNRAGVDRRLSAEFRQTGLVHLLAISGLHLGVLLLAVYCVLRVCLFSPKTIAACVIAFAVAYMLLVDMRPPVVRATVLAVVFAWGLLSERRVLPWNKLAAALLLVVGWNPADLFRVGPQLSFLAVAVLIWIAPLMTGRDLQPLDRLIAETRPWYVRLMRYGWSKTWAAYVASLAVWLAAMPLIAAQFHLVAPAAIWFSPPFMLITGVALMSGLAVCCLAPIVGGAAYPFALICDGSLSWLTMGVEAAAALPGGSFWVSGPAAWWTGGWYGLLAISAIAIRLWGWPMIRGGALLGGWCAIGLLVAMSPPWQASDDLRCTFAAVGHGTAVLVEFPNGSNLLYDCGRLGAPQRATESVAALLWSRGITHLDAIVISHADSDHYNGVPGLLERFSVGRVYVSPVMFERETDALRFLRNSIELAGVPLATLAAGDRLNVGAKASISVLHPTTRGVIGSDNANSLVLLIEAYHKRLLLPGDLETPGLEGVLQEEPIDCDVVMAPHHGSAGSEPGRFLAWSTPEMVVASGSASDRRRGGGELDASGAAVWHTAESGAVTVRLDQAGVETFPYH
ncbi:MAG: ComEC/Rec2 family competence protein [Blastopirellula sp. JB062]